MDRNYIQRIQEMIGWTEGEYEKGREHGGSEETRCGQGHCGGLTSRSQSRSRRACLKDEFAFTSDNDSVVVKGRGSKQRWKQYSLLLVVLYSLVCVVGLGVQGGFGMGAHHHAKVHPGRRVQPDRVVQHGRGLHGVDAFVKHNRKRSFLLPLQQGPDELNVYGSGMEGNSRSRRHLLMRNATLPLHGAVKDYGYFYSSLYIGSPPRKFSVIVDTGSTMTYVPCSSCGRSCGPNHRDAAFDPSLSSTSKPIDCDSDQCHCGSPHCACSEENQCMYTRSYAEQSSSSGVLLEDVLELHDGGQPMKVVFGCETRETGEIYRQRADGIFGLGNSDVSIVNQLVQAGEIRDMFSLCFGLVEGDGVLMLGDSPGAHGLHLQFTPMLTTLSHPYYYTVDLERIEVSEQEIDVDPTVFKIGYSTVLDSGTTFTYLPTLAFKKFAEAVKNYALVHGLHVVDGPDPHYSDLCFGGAPDHDDLEALLEVFPKIALEFRDAVRLELSPINYLFVHTFGSGKYCLGVFDNGVAGTLLGGITFRNVLVQYDRENRRIGFGSAQCKELGNKYRPPCSSFLNTDADPTNDDDLTAALARSEGDCEPDEGTEQYSIDDEELVMPMHDNDTNINESIAGEYGSKQNPHANSKQPSTTTWGDGQESSPVGNLGMSPDMPILEHENKESDLDNHGHKEFAMWVGLGVMALVTLVSFSLLARRISVHIMQRWRYHSIGSADKDGNIGYRTSRFGFSKSFVDGNGQRDAYMMQIQMSTTE